MRQKERGVELLWGIAFADGDLDRYEEHLVRKFANLIHVPHLKFMKVANSKRISDAELVA